MGRTFRFDPDRVAYYEAAGWRAYYDRAWLRLMWLIVGLSREQFRIPFPVSLLAGYYTVRASTAWVPVNHDDRVVQGYLEKFYRIARRYSGLRFDPVRAGALEARYFDVHRDLVGKPDKSAFVQTLVELHGELFGITPEQARESAALRVRAAEAVDRITSKTSSDVAGDWRRLEEDLRRCYRSIQRHLDEAIWSRG
jgi:hypothetical protein